MQTDTQCCAVCALYMQTDTQCVQCAHCTAQHISLSSSQNNKYFKQKLYRKSKHTFCVQKLFFKKNRAVYEIMWGKYGRGGQATGDSMAHAHCMLYN